MTGDARRAENDMIYVVTTFDFGGCSDVKIHAVTEDLAVAEAAYEVELKACAKANAKLHKSDRGAARMMVELTRVEKDRPLHGDAAPTLYWCNKDTALKHNNNDEW